MEINRRPDADARARRRQSATSRARRTLDTTSAPEGGAGAYTAMRARALRRCAVTCARERFGRTRSDRSSATFSRGDGRSRARAGCLGVEGVNTRSFVRVGSSEGTSNAVEGAWEAIRRRASEAPDAPATLAGDGGSATYGTMMRAASTLADGLKNVVDRGTRVGLAATPGREYCASAYATWARGGVLVPIASSHSEEDAAYVMEQSGMKIALVPPNVDGEEDAETYQKYARAAKRFGLEVELRHVETTEKLLSSTTSTDFSDAENVGADEGALIIYTSGTTGRPKGALHTHRSLYAQCAGLIDAWRWDASDRIIHALPMHHIHGIVNAWMCAHISGATVEFQRTFTPRGVWARLRDESKPPVTVFMGVPTMYVMLMRALHGSMAPDARLASINAASKLRLTVSGSAACPVPVLEEWRKLTGRSLLERYGMTEIGMALSNPYDEKKHKPGYVGIPLPGVEVKIAPLVGDEVAAEAASDDEYAQGPGELLVKGANLFAQYYDNQRATAESFDEDGYFKTGDVAAMSSDGYWRILGRASVDILKVGGFKVSALEIEAKLLENPSIAEVAVLGIPDEAYGQRAAALIVPAIDTETGQPVNLTENDIMTWVRHNTPSKHHLRVVKFAEKVPRNAMGKINKKDLQKTHFIDCF